MAADEEKTVDSIDRNRSYTASAAASSSASLSTGAMMNKKSEKSGEEQGRVSLDDPPAVVTGNDGHERGVTGADDAGGSPPPPEAGRTKMQTAVIVMTLAATLFVAALDISIVTVSIPAIALEFQSTVGFTWIGSAYLLANASTAPIWGKISDIWGRKQILLLAVVIFWIGSLLCALSVSMTMLIVSRAVQGMGGGGIIILVNVCIGDLFSPRHRGVYYGIMGIVWAFAGGVGPVLGGFFTESVSWRWCFWINLPVAGVAILILAKVLKLHNPRTPMRKGLAAVDWLGSLTIIAATVMVLMGLTLGGVMFPWNSPTVICLLVIGAALFAAFVLVERFVVPYPLIPASIFSKRNNLFVLGTAFCHGFVTIAGFYFLPLYFQAVLGASPLMSGVYILPFVGSLSLVSIASGFLIKKTGKYLGPIVFGFVLFTLGFGLFIDLGGPSASGPNWAKIIIYQMVAGTGTGPNFQSPLIALQTFVSQPEVASATGTFQFVRQLSTAISVVIGGVVFQNSMEGQRGRLLEACIPLVHLRMNGCTVAQIPGEAGLIARGAYWQSLRTMYTMYVVFAGLGLVCSVFIGSRKLSMEHEEHRTGLKSLVRGRGAPGAAEEEHEAADAAANQAGSRGAGASAEKTTDAETSPR
ncbi:hypothetical protein MAPG_11827 [Magnaporthiopsis poae ATCC 64411]|uniref:Efflux pump dotC n=1 Tax=Magnaporthiopsis poae (strain ATCC 64411 / 73-15) TaxID=644358 RepID=A0A0C4EGA0_MAGP6|nr:hypothetical protein MAPG_11827 [Magnaporthiopsis poae ATCC 64411]